MEKSPVINNAHFVHVQQVHHCWRQIDKLDFSMHVHGDMAKARCTLSGGLYIRLGSYVLSHAAQLLIFQEAVSVNTVLWYMTQLLATNSGLTPT